jgi:hypothetical protein
MMLPSFSDTLRVSGRAERVDGSEAVEEDKAMTNGGDDDLSRASYADSTR